MCEAGISTYYKIRYTTKAAMESSVGASVVTKRKQSYEKHTTESQANTTPATQRRAKYGKRAYGGQRHNETPNNTVGNATYGNDWASLLSRHACRTNWYYP